MLSHGLHAASAGTKVPVFALALSLSVAAHVMAVHGVPAKAWGKPGSAPAPSIAAPMEARLVSLDVLQTQSQPESHESNRDLLRLASLAPVSDIATEPQFSPAPAIESAVIRETVKETVKIHEEIHDLEKTPGPILSTSGFGIPVAQAETYFKAADLDVRAEALNEARIIYPNEAVRARMTGQMKVEIYINREGRIDAVEIIEANPPGVFDQAVLDAIRQIAFSPAQRGGLAVNSLKVIEVPLDPTREIATSAPQMAMTPD